jgi:O-antigen/teichoic acid export membrane protein
MYPSFAADFAVQNLQRIRTRQRDATQVILFLYCLPLSILVAFGEPVLDLVIGREASGGAVTILVLLAGGFFFNAVSAVPYLLALAGGAVRLPIVVNALSLIWYLPALAVAIALASTAGAALVWLLLNASYIVTLIPIVHKRVVTDSTARWLGSSVIPFPLAGLAIFLGLRSLFGIQQIDELGFWVVIAVGAITYAVLASRFLSPALRGHLCLLARSALLRPGGARGG